MAPEQVSKSFVDKFLAVGKEEFYNSLILYIENKLSLPGKLKGITPELELIQYHDKFLKMFRQDKNITYLEMSVVFRKAAHRAYWTMIKKEMCKKDPKFLQVVG